MKMNTYTLETYKKQGKPVFCLVIKSEIYHSVLFFNDMQTLKDRLNYEQKSLSGYGIELEYEKDFLSESDPEYGVIMGAINDDKIAIHNKSGKTYHKNLFRNEKEFEEYLSRHIK